MNCCRTHHLLVNNFMMLREHGLSFWYIKWPLDSSKPYIFVGRNSKDWNKYHKTTLIQFWYNYLNVEYNIFVILIRDILNNFPGISQTLHPARCYNEFGPDGGYRGVHTAVIQSGHEMSPARARLSVRLGNDRSSPERTTADTDQ